MFDYTQLEYLFRERHKGRFVVGYSGGMDSHSLLHALVRCRQKLKADIPILGLHVHHGLSRNADAWARHCQSVCDGLGIELARISVDVQSAGSGPEAAARSARYEAFKEFLDSSDTLLLAHHLDDQVETILYRMFRGSGLKGMGGMPVERPIGRSSLIRPLLSVSRRAIKAYAESEKLTWIDDESNFDLDIDRNYIRHEIVPMIKARWPAYKKTINRFAGLAGADFQLLRELAEQDLDRLHRNIDEPIDLVELRRLGGTRQRNAVLHWINNTGLPLPSQIQLVELVQQLNVERTDAIQFISWPGVEIRVFKQNAYLMEPLAEPESPFIWHADEPRLVGGRLLSARRVKNGGLIDDKRPFSIRFRQGGERCQPQGRVGSHPLKKIFQELEVPPWERDRTPLIYKDDELVAAAGLFVCAGHVAPDGEDGWEITW
jgi:tRNA(Ile)-lysidine synthase